MDKFSCVMFPSALLYRHVRNTNREREGSMYYFDYNAIFIGVVDYCGRCCTREDCVEITDYLRTWAQKNDAECRSIDDIPSDVFQDIIENY